MNKNIAIAIVVFLIGAVVGWLLKPNHGSTVIKEIETTHTVYDTTEKITVVPKVVIRDGPVRIQYDTAREKTEVAPFTARLDTTLDRYRLGFLYHWPENNIDLTVERQPDTTQTISAHTFTETIKVIKDDERFGLSLCVGYAWGVPEITNQTPVLSPENIRIGVMATWDLIKW